MLEINRGYLLIKNDHVAAVITFFIGSDDEKFLYKRNPWTLIMDDPQGDTVYVDQLLVKEHEGNGCIHKEFSKFLSHIKNNFPNVKRAKWMRANVMFRKHELKEGESNVHIKNIR